MRMVLVSETIDASNPVLWFLTAWDGKLADPFAARFQVFSVVSDAATQTFPTTLGTWHDVDLTADKLGLGRFVTAWVVSGGELEGEHLLRVQFKRTSTSAWETHEERFEVLAANALRPHRTLYAGIFDLRNEGLDATACPNGRALRLLELASRRVDDLTRNYFAPVYQTRKVDGSGAGRLGLDLPIVALDGMTEFDTDVDLEGVEVFARHLSENLVELDDRLDPRLEWSVGLIWPKVYRRHDGGRVWSPGVKNVTINAVWGYTDPPGPMGATPDEIRRATAMLVMRENVKLIRFDERQQNLLTSRINQEQTRDQRVGYGAQAVASTYLTGYEEVDQILERYMGPMGIALV